LRPSAVSIHQKFLTPVVVERLLSIAPLVTTWPVNSAQRADELRTWGVNGITSDSLDLLAQLVQRREMTRMH
jgi:hypothetical protein